MKSNDLVKISRKVRNRGDFVDFLRAFANDYEENGKDWENSDLGSFLESLAAFTEDYDGYCENNNSKINSDVPTWTAFCELLLGATIYE